MPIECFLDTNVLIYAAATKKHDPRKASIAQKLIATHLFGVSAQTMAEFYNAVVVRAAMPMPLAEVDEWMDKLAALPFTVVDAEIVRTGIFLSRRYRIPYYDAALLAAADRLSAPIFYSEDLNSGQMYGSVRAINPFL
jgi:predicted nucleic acid-binding protein